MPPGINGAVRGEIRAVAFNAHDMRIEMFIRPAGAPDFPRVVCWASLSGFDQLQGLTFRGEAMHGWVFDLVIGQGGELQAYDVVVRP